MKTVYKIFWSLLFVLFLVNLAGKASARNCYVPYGGAHGGIIVINQPAPQPRTVYVQPPARPLTTIEREQLQGVYRGTGAAAAEYGGGPVIIYNPWVKQ